MKPIVHGVSAWDSRFGNGSTLERSALHFLAHWDELHCDSLMPLGWRERHLIPCARGPRSAQRREFRANRSVRCGEMALETVNNPGRDRILTRIKSALASPSPPRHSRENAPPFPPVGDVLERFQKECAVNNTECTLTVDLSDSARAIAEVLRGIPPGEIFVQDAPE